MHTVIHMHRYIKDKLPIIYKTILISNKHSDYLTNEE